MKFLLKEMKYRCPFDRLVLSNGSERWKIRYNGFCFVLFQSNSTSCFNAKAGQSFDSLQQVHFQWFSTGTLFSLRKGNLNLVSCKRDKQWSWNCYNYSYIMRAVFTHVVTGTTKHLTISHFIFFLQIVPLFGITIKMLLHELDEILSNCILSYCKIGWLAVGMQSSRGLSRNKKCYCAWFTQWLNTAIITISM